jgi:hypothetical protein
MELNLITDESPRVSVVDCLSSLIAIIEANQDSGSQSSVASMMSNMQERCAVVEVDTLEEDGGSDQNAAVCSIPTSISSHLATEVGESGSVEGNAPLAIVEDETASQGYHELPTAAEESTYLPSIVPIGDDEQTDNDGTYASIDKDGAYTSLWSKKRIEMEKKAERKAQQRLHQYNREGKSAEEVIDEALKDYAEFHEMAHTVRLKFEEEKDKVLTLVKSMIDGRQKSGFNDNLNDGKNSHRNCALKSGLINALQLQVTLTQVSNTFWIKLKVTKMRIATLTRRLVSTKLCNRATPYQLACEDGPLYHIQRCSAVHRQL